MTLHERIEAARQAQQRHEQMHDVQLEIRDHVGGLMSIPLYSTEFQDRRQAQIEDESGRDPRD
jgi:hypothetical protein